MRNPREVTLEEILLQGGALTPDQLKIAQQRAEMQEKELTDVLLDDNFVEPGLLASALSFQYGVPVTETDLEKLPIDAEALSLISEETAKKHNVLPLAVDGLLLRVVIEHPINPQTFLQMLDTLAGQTGKQIRPVMPLRQGTIQAAIEKHYRNYRQPDVHLAVVRPSIPQEVIDEGIYDKIINMIIAQAVKDKATEIHLEPHIDLNTRKGEDELKIFYLIAGTLQQAASFHLNIHKKLVACIKSMAGIDIAHQWHFQEGKFTAAVDNQNIIFRVVTIGTSQGEMVIMFLKQN